jgi:hypothetical protein
MDQDPLHQKAVEVAKRILSGTHTERYELGVTEPADNARLFDDLVELATQLLREEEISRTCRNAA